MAEIHQAEAEAKAEAKAEASRFENAPWKSDKGTHWSAPCVRASALHQWDAFFERAIMCA